MQSSVFAVNDEPYCLWEVDLSARTRAFLDGLDPGYFDYVLQTHINTEDEKRALVAIKLSLHHATETMFALLGSFVQAPDCPYAWVAKCSNTELREFVGRVSREEKSLITKLNIPRISWHSIATAVFAYYQPGTVRQEATISCFARLWGTLVHELNSQTSIDEYNALKHGFRARPGGFSLAVGQEDVRGAPPSKSNMTHIGQSEFGATFLKIESLGSAKKSLHIRSRQTSVNWSMERIVLLHQLVYMSINNVVSALKSLNGYAPDTCTFIRPEQDTDFDRPWTYSSGVTSMNFDYLLDETLVPALSKSDLIEKLRPK